MQDLVKMVSGLLMRPPLTTVGAKNDEIIFKNSNQKFLRVSYVMGMEKGTFWDEYWVLYGNQFDNKFHIKKMYTSI